MKPVWIISALAAACCAGLALASSSAQRQRAPADYWPLKHGSEWYFTEMGPSGKMFRRMTAQRIMTRPDPQAVSMAIQDFFYTVDLHGKMKGLGYLGNSTWSLRKDSAGLWMLAGRHGMFEPPLQIARPTLESGASWSWSGRLKSAGKELAASAQVVVAGPEDLKSAAHGGRSIRTMRVSVSLTRQGLPKADTHFWLAEGIGPLRINESGGVSSLTKLVLK